jgi:hypothetical protein
LDAVRRAQSEFVQVADKTRFLPRQHSGKLTDIVEGALTQAGTRPYPAGNAAPANSSSAAPAKSANIVDLTI